MKSIIVGFTLVALMGTPNAFGVSKASLDNRIRKLTIKFEQLQEKPGKRIPAEVLAKAQGIILLDRTKAGFIFAFQGGSGVAMVKDPATGQWGAPAFLNATEASLGFQIGGQQSFIVILLMNTNATEMLRESDFEFGGEARGTAGDDSAGVEGVVKSQERSVLVYDDRAGLYGGAAIKGGALSPEPDANMTYYDKAISMPEILFDRKVKPSDAANELIKKINDYSKK